MVSQCIYYPGMPVSLLSIKVSKPEMQQEEFWEIATWGEFLGL